VSAFTDNLSIEPFPDYENGKKVWKWCLTAGLHWEVGYQGSGLWIVVPEGFVTDLASVPWWARWLRDPNRPETAKAAAVHDWMTPTKAERAAEYRPLWDNRTGAGEFYSCLKAGGLGLFERKLYYFAVVLGIARDEW
jgi:hypothetical protein